MALAYGVVRSVFSHGGSFSRIVSVSDMLVLKKWNSVFVTDIIWLEGAVYSKGIWAICAPRVMRRCRLRWVAR